MYIDQYDKLINDAELRNWPIHRHFIAPVYTEVHHIVPKCMGGTNDTSNLVRLTGQEHFNAHLLLAKAHPTVNGLVLAAKRVSTINGIKISADEYTALKENAKVAISEQLTGIVRSTETREKIRKARLLTNGFRGKLHTEETKAALSAASSGENNGMFGKKHTKVVCDNLSKLHAGKKLSEDHKTKLKESHASGWQQGQGAKDKMKGAWSQRPLLVCPRCGMQSKNVGNLNRWHFNNCKKKDVNDKQDT